MHFYEDLAELARSAKFGDVIASGRGAISTKNKRPGVRARRGDGTFGEVLPGEAVVRDPGYKVPRGLIATVEIGIEVKILQKAMIKQIDRVTTDLINQANEFRIKSGGGQAIRIGVVGINHAEYTIGYEGARSYRTTGVASYRHPAQEAADARQRLEAKAAPSFEELLFLPFKATNEAPFPFEWVNGPQVEREYAAALVRTSSQYQSRF